MAVNLTWSRPTLDDGGAALPAGDIQYYRIFRGGVEIDTTTTGGPSETYTDVAVLGPGQHDYTIVTVTVSGASVPSNVASVVVPSGIAAAITDLAAVLS